VRVAAGLIVTMLCCKPLMDVTRRQVLGLGVVAFGALRLSPPAFAATGPELFELALDDTAARAAGARWRTSKVIAAPRRFDLVGLRWSKAASLQAQVRARTAGGRWTAWTALPPSHGAGVPGTDPAFTGAADELQLRLRGDARGLKLRFVRALPHAPAPRARAAQAPFIVPRDSWGAAQVPPRSGPSYGTVQMAFVHHTAGTIEYSPEDSPGIVLGIARYHRDSNGWNDIGYNFLVDRYGVIFEGRAGGVDAAVVGAQAQGWNSQSTGIATLGTFTSIPLDEPAMEALARLLGWKLSVHGIPTQGVVTLTSGGGASNRFPNGTPVTFERISAHRDSNETTCPGDALYAQLPDLRARAVRYAVPLSALIVRAASQRGTNPVAISGRLQFGDGSSPDGAALALEYTTAGSAWSPLTTTNAGPDGAWAASAVLPSSGQVRAVFPGDAARARLESAPVNVRVVPSMALTTDKRRARAGTAFAISGTMAPSQPRVVCLLERQVRGRWRTVQRKRINVRGGRFATKVKPKSAGLYRVSIIADGVTRRRTLRATR
jgi:uncharacterized protein with LGFP repeats